MSNKKVTALFANASFCEYIADLSRKQIGRRKLAYSSASIFDAEDLEQEIWCELLDSGVKSGKDAKEKAFRVAEALAAKGNRRNNNSEYKEIPISQLGETERRKTNNLFYGSSFCDIA